MLKSVAYCSLARSYWREASSVIIVSKANFMKNEEGNDNIRSFKSTVDSKSSLNHGQNFQVLMLRRSATNKFAPKSYVFPGGTTHKADASAEWLDLCKYFGYETSHLEDTDIQTKAILPPMFSNKAAHEISKTLSLRITAIRETFEESGILLCRNKFSHESNPSVWSSYLGGSKVQEWQSKVQKCPYQFMNLCKEVECFPDVWSLHLWSNWLTPPVYRARFDTAFFIAVFDQKPPAYIDDNEIDKMKWCTPEEIIHKKKSLSLFPPQLYEISRLCTFDTAECLVNFAIQRAKLGCEQWMPVNLKAVDGEVSLLPVNMTYQCFEELPLHVQEALQKSGLDSVKSLLLCSKSKARKLVDLREEELEEAKLVAAKSVSRDGIICALKAHQALATMQRSLSVGCNTLNKFLHGGLKVWGITEITGESGTGKTQLCLQLAVNVNYEEKYGGLNGGAVYISTEKIFPSRRLQELLNKFTPTFHDCDVPKPNVRFGDNIFIEHIADVNSLKTCIVNRLPRLLSCKSIGLIVIDSIAGVFRTDYEKKDLGQRSKDLHMIGRYLHKLSRQYSLVVICVNQVACITNEAAADIGGDKQVVAALNLSWANLVTTRLQLYRRDRQLTDTKPLRIMETVFSPFLPQSCCGFSLSDKGIVGVPLSD